MSFAAVVVNSEKFVADGRHSSFFYYYFTEKIKFGISSELSARQLIFHRQEGLFSVKKHYENMPIQIYRKSHPQKLKIFRQKILIFFIFLLKT